MSMTTDRDGESWVFGEYAPGYAWERGEATCGMLIDTYGMNYETVDPRLDDFWKQDFFLTCIRGMLNIHEPRYNSHEYYVSVDSGWRGGWCGFFETDFVAEWLIEHGYHIEAPVRLPGYHDLLADAMEQLDAEADESGKLSEAVSSILLLNNRARQDGILILEHVADGLINTKKYEPEEAAFLKQTITMIAECYEPERIVEIMTNEYLTLGPKGCLAMRLYIYLRGSLMIQAGDTNERILQYFHAIMPYPWREQFYQREEGKDERI